VRDGDEVRAIDLASAGVLMGEGTFDPPTTPLDADGQGVPYATYAFAAQMATVEVDIELGTVKVLRIIAAHDVARRSSHPGRRPDPGRRPRDLGWR